MSDRSDLPLVGQYLAHALADDAPDADAIRLKMRGGWKLCALYVVPRRL